jgi:hypothetical protein
MGNLSNSEAADMEIPSSTSHPEPLWDSLIQRVPWVLFFGVKAGVSMNLSNHHPLGLILRMSGALPPCSLDASKACVLLKIDLIFVTDIIKISLLTVSSGDRTVQALGSWVRIPFEAWKYGCFYPVFVLSCTGRGLVIG